jgi:hypothetical protein
VVPIVFVVVLFSPTTQRREIKNEYGKGWD